MSKTSFAEQLRQALEAHREGSPARAIPLYEKAIAADPDDAEALSLYGLALVHAGRPADAEAPLRRAVDMAPSQPGYRLNLAELFFKVGEDQTGVDELRRALAGNPNYGPALARLGKALILRNELPEAAEVLDRALQARPDDFDVALRLARVFAAIRNFGGAYHVLDHVEKFRPDDLDTIRLRLEIARSRRDFPAIETLGRRLIKLAPEDPTGWRDLAAAFFENGLYADAIATFERAIALSTRDAESLSQLATMAINALEFEKAEAALAEAEAMAPEHPRMLSTRALLATYQGEKSEAEDYCLRCLKADPTYADVFPQLSVLRGGRLDEAEENIVRDRSRRADVAPSGRASSSFILAHSYEARGDYEGAFEEFLYANREADERNRLDQIAYDFEGHAAWTDAIINVFRGPAEPTEADDGPQPIFIVGLPRCGSTLVESMIAAHSMVAPGGELPMMPNIFNAWFRQNHQFGEVKLLPEERRKIADEYRRGAPPHVGAGRFTDKNLLNIEGAGFIAKIFPKAVIINVRRNPVENALAIWRQDMLKFWAFATDFDNIAKRYGLYAKLVRHFEETLPGRFLTVQYEDFVRDFGDRSRSLIAACDLQWEDACADFQATRVIAPTMSAIQVREEVGIRDDRTAHYGARLDPLRRALEQAGVDLKTGALV